MELFNRVKSILLNPKEEWEVIEVENKPHAKVLTGYLLILALIPTLAFFAGEYFESRSMYNEYIENGTAQIEKMSYYNSSEISAEIVRFEEQAKEYFRINHSFCTTKWNIIFALCLFGIIVGGAYISAAIINALSGQFGSEKDFNRAFSLTAYSLTPLCVAGVLYAFHSFASFAPYIGLYGLYLLYLGVAPQVKPAVDKKTTCFIISAIAIAGVWLCLARGVVPEIQKKIMTAELISIKKDKDTSGVLRIDAAMRKSLEKQSEYELRNHKY